tara:strand:+ start:51 stop:686 length:636 start_codon:yes stop_codon:yes gene_type:complete
MKTKLVNPSNYGWIEGHLDKNEVDHLWDCIKTARGKTMKSTLVGQIDRSYRVEDKDGWFWTNVLERLTAGYGKYFDHEHVQIYQPKDKSPVQPYLESMWVNYQSAGEYQPIHNHAGVYSFAIWLKEPVEFEDQAKIHNATDASKSFNDSFQFQYTNIFGEIKTHLYALGKKWENTILFFPSQLLHTVSPFFECDEQRVSLSGNVFLKNKPE